ncbi:MAG TPA: nuclear transport factor 2 family protein [Myxococcota bacterium]|nr:nuclear transport factor 2 family protein [Myxococcota bacterium]
MSIRNDVQAVIDGIRKGEILETFDRFYADDVVMSENGADPREGKAANRAYEEAFVDGVEFHGAEVGEVLVDGDRSAVEWTFDLTPKGGERVKQRQVALQVWRDGKIARETFYHG